MKEFMSVPLGQKAYQPCGDLWIDFEGHGSTDSYRRWLDLDTARVATEYEAGGITYRREVFASYPDRVICVRVTAGQPGKLNCAVRLSSAHKDAQVTVSGNDTLVLRGQVEAGGIRFESRALLQTDGGKVTAESGALRIAGANALVIRLVAATNFKNYRDISGDPTQYCTALLQKAAAKSYEQLRQAHEADYRSLFRRVTLDLGRTAAAGNPTDQRIREFAGGNDPDLAALAFQYARYLLVASSREGGQPANLQGIWNSQLKPPWDSKYTCNINTEMNYWPAEPANLAECETPLFAALAELVESGREVAQKHYGARGWVLHHNFDLWRGTAPINASNHGIWVTGGAWLCMQLWDHYLFTLDKEFLRTRAYPIMKEAALFFTDYLVADPLTGWLISGPSNSPEQGGLVMGPTMDHAIIRSLFKACVEAARVLNTDGEFAARLADMWPRIAPNQVGQYGQLQEWLEDKDDPQNTHRHVSHLWSVYPGWDITWRDKKFFDAARQSLIYRGDAATGWSMGWKVNLWATVPRRRPRLPDLAQPAAADRQRERPGGHVPQPVRCPPAVPDRRQLRRLRGHRGDARAIAPGRNPPAARPAPPMAGRLGQGAPRPRQFHRGYRMEGRQSHAIQNCFTQSAFRPSPCERRGQDRERGEDDKERLPCNYPQGYFVKAKRPRLEGVALACPAQRGEMMLPSGSESGSASISRSGMISILRLTGFSRHRMPIPIATPIPMPIPKSFRLGSKSYPAPSSGLCSGRRVRDGSAQECGNALDHIAGGPEAGRVGEKAVHFAFIESECRG